MKTRLKLILPVFVSALFFTACNNDDDVVDTQKPVIAISEPHDDEDIAPGGELHFEALFTDNVELASYKIEIHEAFDDHSHGYNKSSHQSNPWSYSQVFQIPAGLTRHEAVQHIDVPLMINGNPISEGVYHFGVYVTDRAGNEEQAFLDIHIEAGDHDHDHD